MTIRMFSVDVTSAQKKRCNTLIMPMFGIICGCSDQRIGETRQEFLLSTKGSQRGEKYKKRTKTKIQEACFGFVYRSISL